MKFVASEADMPDTAVAFQSGDVGALQAAIQKAGFLTSGNLKRFAQTSSIKSCSHVHPPEFLCGTRRAEQVTCKRQSLACSADWAREGSVSELLAGAWHAFAGAEDRFGIRGRLVSRAIHHRAARSPCSCLRHVGRDAGRAVLLQLPPVVFRTRVFSGFVVLSDHSGCARVAISKVLLSFGYHRAADPERLHSQRVVPPAWFRQVAFRA